MSDGFTSSEFFRTYAPRLRNFLTPRISPRLRRRFDADDILNSAFRSYFLRQPVAVDLADDWNPWPLLVEIAVHKLARQVRRNTAARRAIDQEAGDAEFAAEISPNADVQAELAEILALVQESLNADERRAWQLRLDGWELLEIGEQMAVSERTIRRYLNQAKAKLCELLQSTHIVDLAARPPKAAENRSGWTSFSHYTLRRQIGVGSVGKVYQANDKRTSEIVAVKFLKKLFTHHAAARESILAEIEFGAKLHHPAVIRIAGIGTTPNDGLFLVTEYLPGGNLAESFGRRCPDLRVLKSWVIALAEGLDYAHASGIIHCDLKPANVLFDGDGRPKIGDFGLGQWLTSPVVGVRGGTPAYLAPELLDPMFGNPGPWTDVFGLGAIVREGLTGQPPYDDSPSSAVFAQIVDRNPIPWPAESARVVPQAWRDFCTCCLAKQTSARPSSVRDLRSDIAKLPIE